MTITRERHPFEGRSLAVIGSIRRRGVLFVLACLPDGSRALIPAQWTDWDEGQVAANARAEMTAPARACSAGLAICFSCAISSTLSTADPSGRRSKESSRATEPGLSRPPDLPPNPSPAASSATPWEQIDAASRIAALEILARLIARMISARSTREASDE